MSNYLKLVGNNAAKAFKSKISTDLKNKVLNKFSQLIKKNKKKIINQNKKDINFAKKIGLKKNLIDRLEINNNKLDEIIESVRKIAKLKDPADIV